MAGQAVILLIPYLNRVIKRISERTGASLWFRRYTCGFSVAQLRNDNASCRRVTVRGPAPEARCHGRCHVALHGRPSSSESVKSAIYAQVFKIVVSF